MALGPTDEVWVDIFEFKFFILFFFSVDAILFGSMFKPRYWRFKFLS